MEDAYSPIYGLPKLTHGVIDRQAVLHNIYNNFISIDRIRLWSKTPDAYINTVNNEIFNVNDTFYYLVRRDLRLCKFLIEDMFGCFYENNWLYFTILPENYKLFVYKFNLLSF